MTDDKLVKALSEAKESGFLPVFGLLALCVFGDGEHSGEYWLDKVKEVFDERNAEEAQKGKI